MDDLWQRNHTKKKKFINLITRSNHIWVGSWNTVGSHSFFCGEVTRASLVAFFLGMRERDSEACSVGRERVRESFWNFLIGVSVKKRERRNWKSREKWGLTRIANVSNWAVQFLSIRSIEWLGLKQLHTVQYPRNYKYMNPQSPTPHPLPLSFCVPHSTWHSYLDHCAS